MSCEQAFFKKLRERNFRLTPQREMVLSVMHQLENFSTAEEIYGRVQVLSSAVDISTVYRTLELLQDFEMVACVNSGDGQRRYELISDHDPHLHLVCRSCGEVLGADLGPARSLVEYLKENYDFDVNLDGLSIPGLCPKCSG